MLRCQICGSTEPWGRDPKDVREGESCSTARCPGTLLPPQTRDLDAEMEGHRARAAAIITNMEN